MADKQTNLIANFMYKGQADANKLNKDTKEFGDNAEKSSKSGNLFSRAISTIGSVAAGVIAAGVITNLTTQVVSFFGDSIDSAEQFAKAMTTLEIIAPRFGQSADLAKQKAEELGKELRIGPGAAAEALQNLLKSGLNIPQATELIKRFANEAITGKSPTISLSQAVQNLSFAYATGNSALGNLSGVSENFINITEKGRQALLKQGVAEKDITEDMAKYKGMMDLTNLTLGSAARFTGTLTDTKAELSQRVEELKIRVGTRLAPILNEMLKIFMNIGDFLSNRIMPVFENITSFVGGNFVPTINKLRNALGLFFEIIANNQDDGDILIEKFGDIAKTPLVDFFFDIRHGLEDVWKLFTRAGASIQDSIQRLQPTFERLRNVLGKFGDKFINVFNFAVDKLQKFWDIIKPAFTWIADHVGLILEGVVNGFTGFLETVNSLIDALETGLAGAFHTVESAINSVAQVIKNFTDSDLSIFEAAIMGITLAITASFIPAIATSAVAAIQTMIGWVVSATISMGSFAIATAVSAVGSVISFVGAMGSVVAAAPAFIAQVALMAAPYLAVGAAITAAILLAKELIDLNNNVKNEQKLIDYSKGASSEFETKIKNSNLPEAEKKKLLAQEAQRAANLKKYDEAPQIFGVRLPGFAQGTDYFEGGYAVVGEQGPEIAEFPRGTKINSNQDSQKMGRDININVYGDMDPNALARILAFNLKLK